MRGADRSLGDAARGGGVCLAVATPVPWRFDRGRPIQRQSHLGKPPAGGVFVDFLGLRRGHVLFMWGRAPVNNRRADCQSAPHSGKPQTEPRMEFYATESR